MSEIFDVQTRLDSINLAAAVLLFISFEYRWLSSYYPYQPILRVRMFLPINYDRPNCISSIVRVSLQPHSRTPNLYPQSNSNREPLAVQIPGRKLTRWLAWSWSFCLMSSGSRGEDGTAQSGVLEEGFSPNQERSQLLSLSRTYFSWFIRPCLGRIDSCWSVLSCGKLR